MSLRKVEKYCWLDIQVKGKRIRRSLRPDNKFLVLDRYKEKKDELIGEYAGKKTKFSTFKEKYLEWAWSSKPASTLREKQRLEKIQEFFEGLGIQFLDDITHYHIEQLKTELKKTGLIKDPKKAKGISKPTINRYLQILRGMFYKAIDWEVYNKPNPVKKVRFYKEDPRVKTLSKEDLDSILETARSIAKKPRSQLQKIFPDLIELAINTGLRKSEILRLKWKDVREDEIIVRGKEIKRGPFPSTARLEKRSAGSLKNQSTFSIFRTGTSKISSDVLLAR